MAGLDEGKGELARKKEAGYGKTEVDPKDEATS
jgi:hypothetical protein